MVRDAGLKNIKVIIISLALLVVACNSKMTPYEVEARKVEKVLSWVADVDPREMASEDIKNNSIKFYQVCSYSCSTVGIGSINGKRCFPSISHMPIKGTSDVVLSDKHSLLMDIAYDFSKQYNTVVAEHLKEQGASKCSQGVDWGAAHKSLTQFVWSLEIDISKQGNVGISVEKKSNQTDFTVLLPNRITNELNKELCESLAEFLPNEQVSIEVSARQNIESVSVIWCENGKQINRT